MLWFGLHLPALSLETFSALLEPPARARPVALLARHRSAAANAAACERGVAPGMKGATAVALVPDLLCGEADPARDAEALQCVAHALMAFTPAVTLVPPEGLVAEVQASLRCFGGPAGLLAELAGRGYQLKQVEPAPGSE